MTKYVLNIIVIQDTTTTNNLMYRDNWTLPGVCNPLKSLTFQVPIIPRSVNV